MKERKEKVVIDNIQSRLLAIEVVFEFFKDQDYGSWALESHHDSLDNLARSYAKGNDIEKDLCTLETSVMNHMKERFKDVNFHSNLEHINKLVNVD